MHIDNKILLHKVVISLILCNCSAFTLL